MTRTVADQSAVLTRAQAVAARGALALALLIGAGELAGCAGLTNPYQGSSTGPQRTIATAPTTAANSGDPAPERGGTLSARAQAALARLANDAARPTPQAALERYALLYANWNAATVVAHQQQLAAISLGQARAQALQAAASLARDPKLTGSHVANTGAVVAIAQGTAAAAGQWVIVTREQTTGQGDYAGLPPTLHVIYAQLTRTQHGFVVEQWQAQS